MALVAVRLLPILARSIFARSNKWLLAANLTSPALMLLRGPWSTLRPRSRGSTCCILPRWASRNSRSTLLAARHRPWGPPVDYLLISNARARAAYIKDVETMRENMALRVERAED